MADHRLAGRDTDFLELRLLANGILEATSWLSGRAIKQDLKTTMASLRQAEVLDHFLQSADFMKELQPLGKQHVVEQAAHACRPPTSLPL